MEHLYQLLCVPKSPSISINDLKSGNLDQFLSTSMRSATSLKKDHHLKQEATQELTKLLGSRSNSPKNTLRMVNTMFETASKACHHSKERALIDWLQTCVSTAMQLSIDPNSVLSEKPRKASAKNQAADETDVSWEEDDGERYIGDSDEDYMPSDDDAVVPSKKKKSDTKTSRKKKNQDQVVPPSPPKSSKDAVIPVLKEGAGAKALQKYFADLESNQIVPKSTSNALADGYFVRAFFFPSKDSFNVSLFCIKKIGC